MKRNRLFAGALALVMTAVAVSSPMRVSSVNAAEVADKEAIDFEITGNYTEKKISDADANVINKAFGYDSGSNTVYICGADAKGYIDWSNSAVDSWKVYQTEVFQPVLSKDANGNLVVATDEEGYVQKAWSTYATYGTKTADVTSHRTEDAKGMIGSIINSSLFFSDTYCMTNKELNQLGRSIQFDEIFECTDTFVWGLRYIEGFDYVLSENHFCLSTECDKHIQTINSHLGLTELTTWKALSTEEQMQEFYASEQTQITDAYVIRVYYTADDIPMNWAHRYELRNLATYISVPISDVYGTVHGEVDASLYYFNMIPITTENREFRYTDIWILPEGVETVLNLEDTVKDETTDNISIKKANVKLSKTSYTYDGKEKKPSVSVKLNGKTLVKNKDYTVSYKNNKNIGTATVSIKGKGNYTGTVSQKFKIQLAKGKTFTSGKYKYKVTGTSTVAFDGIKSTSTTKVVIPNTVKYGGKTFKVTSISEDALKKKTKVTSVTIGANVSKIGANAFWGCKKLSTVTMGKAVTTIGTSAFEGCTKLSKVTMGSVVMTIGTKAFKNCTSLKSITIPSKVTKINKQAFYGCKNLKTITIKTTKLKTVGKEIFKGIHSKATIKVPKSKLSAYKKLLKGKGQGSKVKIVKY